MYYNSLFILTSLFYSFFFPLMYLSNFGKLWHFNALLTKSVDCFESLLPVAAQVNATLGKRIEFASDCKNTSAIS